MSYKIDTDKEYPAHNIFEFSGTIFSSNFDNGNLLSVSRGQSSNEFLIRTAPDNYGTPYVSGHCSWFHFSVSNLLQNCDSKGLIKFVITNGTHNILYKQDMRPVYKSPSTNNKWVRIKSPVRTQKAENNSLILYFDHIVESSDNLIFFAFTYPYSYTMVQNDISILDNRVNEPSNPNSLYASRELLTQSVDGLRVDLITITNANGILLEQREEALDGLFPNSVKELRPHLFPKKEVIFVSARVHPGEVPAQHTWKVF